MTTIVCDREGMAADTRVTGVGAIYHAPKIFRIGTSLFGTAGHGSMCLVMIEWLKTARNRDRLYKQWGDYERSEIVLVELRPGGIYLWDGWGVEERINDKTYAIGSGSMAALAALRKGESLEDSVREAIPLDECTGGDVQVEYLLPPELARKRRKRA